MTHTRLLIVGNWKMHPASVAQATKLARELKKKIGHAMNHAAVAIAPPFVYVGAVSAAFESGTSIALGAQDVFPGGKGNYTSQISLEMLADFRVQYVIIGHSERRALGETDDMVNAKLTAVTKAGMVGIVCVGEDMRDSSGHYLSRIEEQVRRALSGISKAKLDRVVIAYEPLWAIGTGLTATPADVHEIKLFIERILVDLYGRTQARKVRILYGGSVNAKNVGLLAREAMVDGFLVGGASLKPAEFSLIVRATEQS